MAESAVADARPRRSRVLTWWRAQRRRLLRFWGTGFAVTAVVTAISWSGLLESTQAKTLDFLLKARGQQLPSDVVIVAIDDDAFTALGQRQPLSRAYIAGLIRALSRSGAAVVGLDFDFSSETAEDAVLAATVREVRHGGVSRVVLSSLLPPTGPLAALATSPDVLHGAVEVSGDADGTIRRGALLLAQHDRVEPALSTAVAARYVGMDPGLLSAAAAAGRIPAGDRGKTIDARPGQLWRINFVGPAKSFLTIPAGPIAALADAKAVPDPENPLRGKAVLIGATFRDSRDFHDTPNGTMPGVEVHANLVHMMLTDSFLHSPAWLLGLAFQMAVVVAAGIVAVTFPPIVATVACFVGPFVIGLPASLIAFHRGGYWLDFMLPAVTTRLFWTAVDMLERRRFRDAFSRYVSPELASRVLQEAPSLSGERRTVSILFSDLRGFTTLSETMDPPAIARHLSEYFDAMTTAIFEQHGMINDFVGDAIMATFGAPLDDRDHALHAARAAIAMERALGSLNQRWAATGAPPLHMGIGIHTGEVFAGNVGGTRRLKYAVVGDTVNLASRVEGLNKELETTILITEATRGALDGRVTVRDRGAIPVKGRNEPVHVHELTAVGADAGPARRGAKR